MLYERYEHRGHMKLRHPEVDGFMLSDGFDGGALKLFQGSLVFSVLIRQRQQRSGILVQGRVSTV